MGCCSGLAKFILILVNVILMLIWLAVMIAGALLAWGSAVIKPLLDGFLKPFVDGLAKETQGQITSESVVQLIEQYGSSVGIALFVIGLCLALICIFGCIGACCENKCLLVMYIIAMSIFVVIEVIICIIYFAKPEVFMDPARKEMKNTIKEFVSLEDTNAESLLWNLLQPSFKCCGVANSNDFNAKDAPKFKRTRQYKGVTVNLAAPITCCKMSSDYQPATGCPQTFNAVNSNINTGCFGELEKEIMKYSNVVMYIFIGLIVFQLLLIAFAAVISCHIDQLSSGKTY